MGDNMLSTKDIYWLAGLLEGEGYFGLRRQCDLVIELTMTDRDVVERFHRILDFGARDERMLPSSKIAYGWSLTNQRHAAGLMMMLYPLMGERRQAKIRECLAAWREKPLPKAMWTHCKHGHPLSGGNLYRHREGNYQKRRCRQCGVDRQTRYRSKRAEQ